MTREEAIILIKAALKTMYLPKSKEYISDLGYALEIAIKALEQEPCEVVLNKIREEIESHREEVSKKHSEDEGLSNYYFGLNDGLKDARDILDKYMSESEGT